MAHPLVEQLYFTRSEFMRGIEGVSADDATRHFGRMNCISWTIGHMGWQEQRQWLTQAQDKVLVPKLNEVFAYQAPMSTPSLEEALDAWRTVTEASASCLEALTTADLERTLVVSPLLPAPRTYGSAMQRLIYHYWYHNGEIQAMRQLLDQADLPQFVGPIEVEAPYRREP